MKEEKPKNKGGRPKGSKDKLPRLRVSPSRRDVERIIPGGPSKAMAMFTARIINSNKLERVVEKIVASALDDEHNHQAAAWKLIMDRGLPVSMFENKEGGSKPQININITGNSEIDVSEDK